MDFAIVAPHAPIADLKEIVTKDAARRFKDNFVTADGTFETSVIRWITDFDILSA